MEFSILFDDIEWVSNYVYVFLIFFPFFIVSLGFCLEYYAIINRFTWFLFSPWIVPNKNVFDSVFYPKKNNQLWQQKNSFHKKKHVELDWIAYLLKWCIQMHAFWNRIIFDYIDTERVAWFHHQCTEINCVLFISSYRAKLNFVQFFFSPNNFFPLSVHQFQRVWSLYLSQIPWIFPQIKIRW